jgi:hypothetical protein
MRAKSNSPSPAQRQVQAGARKTKSVFPATDPANAPQRAEFKLGIFPPDHHVPPAAPTPPAPQPPAK